MTEFKNPKLERFNEKKESNNIGFDLNNLSMKQFQAFLILNSHSGEELSVLVKVINSELKLKNKNKGYDHIKKVCEAGYAYKRKVEENGKIVTRVYVSIKVKKEYNKMFIPTMEITKKMVEEALEDYLNEFRDLDKIRKDYKAYSIEIIKAVQNLALNTSSKNFTKKQFIKRINDTIMGHYKAKMFKLGVWTDLI